MILVRSNIIITPLKKRCLTILLWHNQSRKLSCEVFMAVGMKTCSLVHCDCFATCDLQPAASIFNGYKTVAEGSSQNLVPFTLHTINLQNTVNLDGAHFIAWLRIKSLIACILPCVMMYITCFQCSLMSFIDICVTRVLGFHKKIFRKLIYIMTGLL